MSPTTRKSQTAPSSTLETRFPPETGRLGAALLAILACAGCLAPRGDVELLEAHLRRQQDRLYELERQLTGARGELRIAREEADILRVQLTGIGQRPVPPEYTQALFQVQGVQFNSLMTGSRNRDGRTGDDVLVAVLSPLDEHGDLVKLVGTIELEAIDLSRPEGERRIGHWTFSPDEARTRWKSGLFSAGYQFELPWQQSPQSDSVLLHGRLTTADGRQFDATHTIRVRPALPGGAPQRFDAPAARPVGDAADSRPSSPPTGRARLKDGEFARKVQHMSRTARPADEPILRAAHEESDPGTVLPSSGITEWALPPETAHPDPTDGPPSRAGAPPPTSHAGVQTSDNWTDETIPRLR